MKELRPIHTFLLALVTTLILVALSAYIPSDDNEWVRRVDILSELRSDSEPFQDDVDEQWTADDEARYEDGAGSHSESDSHYAANDTSLMRRHTSGQESQLADSQGQANGQFNQKIATLTARSELGVFDQPLFDTALKEQTQSKTRAAERPSSDRSQVEYGAALAPFLNKLHDVSSMGRPLRVAVLGDSFIEGDIFTQDLRELFQTRFGGQGVGFVPLASSVAGFRQTVGHTFSGWATHCITSSAKRGGYTMSSYTYSADDGAVASYKGSKSRRNLDKFSRARFMFINRQATKIKAKVNGVTDHSFSPTASNELQQIIVVDDSIASVQFSLTSTNGFTGYGVYLDGARGVCVDNYSVRGNSGTTLAATDAALLGQVNTLMPIDLIIFEYGLNVAGSENRNYSQYLLQMKAAVTHLKRAFPNAAILVMSVPDRAHRTMNGWRTMPGIAAMESTQRQLAMECGTAFWSTMRAMQKQGGMGEFVRKGWAAKDYTHLSTKGGRVVARSLFDDIMALYEGN